MRYPRPLLCAHTALQRCFRVLQLIKPVLTWHTAAMPAVGSQGGLVALLTRRVCVECTLGPRGAFQWWSCQALGKRHQDLLMQDNLSTVWTLGALVALFT